jgi:hypothetical protein
MMHGSFYGILQETYVRLLMPDIRSDGRRENLVGNRVMIICNVKEKHSITLDPANKDLVSLIPCGAHHLVDPSKWGISSSMR